MSFVLAPLLLGLSLMIFSLTTEYWTRLDFAKIRHQKELAQNSRSNNLKLKKIKLGLAKYTSLFGECDEFKLLDVWMPAADYELELLYNLTQAELTQTTTPPTESSSDEPGPVIEATSLRQTDNADCISAEKCAQLNKIVNGSCFCCSDRCCLLKTKMCDGVSNCRDRSDEAETCPMRRLYFASNYTDNRHNCIRHQYNMWEFAKGVFDRAVMGNRVKFDYTQAGNHFTSLNYIQKGQYVRVLYDRVDETDQPVG